MALAPVEQPPRAAIYCRISADDQRDELGVRRQEANARRTIESRGWQLARVYCDNNRSASSERVHRPEFARLMADVTLGLVDIVVVQNQDRLTRRVDELEQIARALRAAGHRSFWTVSAGEQRIDSTNARLGYRVKGLFDAAYSEYISEKVMEKKDELASQGRPAGGGSRPYGYEHDRMTPRPAEAAVVVEVAERIARKESIYAIAADLNERGIRSATGREWSPNQLRNTVTSPRVAGLRQHRGEVVGEAAWPALMPRALWERVRTIVNDPSRQRPGRPIKALLTGILVCGQCGATLMAGTNNGKPAYVCVKRPNWPGCGRLAIAREPLDELIEEAVLRRFDGPMLASRLHPGVDGANEAADEIRQLNQRLDEAAEMFADGEIDRRAWMVTRKRLDERLDAARQRLDKESSTAALDHFRSRAGVLRREWSDYSVNQRRAVVMAAIPGAIEIAPAIRGRNRFDPDRITSVGWADLLAFVDQTG
jgi:DNA invertase Pin-like site-specific DNA recombinase